MIKATFQIIFWRLWDKIIKLIWPFTNVKLRNYLWSIIDFRKSLHESIRGNINSNVGAIIQVGANDGVSNDPLRRFIKETKSSVYLIEPLPFLVKKLKKLYIHQENIKVLQCAILPNKKSAIFYHLDEESALQMGDKWKPWFDQIGSFSKDHLLKHSTEIIPHIKELNVNCYTLEQVIADEKIDDILMLHVDAEGYDIDVLKTISIEKRKPHMILFEQKHLSFFKLLWFLHQLRLSSYIFHIMHDDILCIHQAVSTD